MLNLKKKRKPGVCDAMRCISQPEIDFANDVKLCDKHSDQYEAFGLESATEPDDDNENNSDVDQDQVLAITKPAETEALTMIESLNAIEIHDQEMFDTASNILTDVKSQFKELEDMRTSATKPMLQAKRKVDAWFTPATKALKECEAILKEKMTGYIEQLEQAKLEALQDGDHATAIAVPDAQLPDNVQERSVWDYEIENFDDVPRDLLALDHSAVKILMKDHDPALLNIPGLKFYKRKILAVGTK